MMVDATKSEVIENLRLELEAQGYNVFFRPSQMLVPSFFADYAPDALAMKTDANAGSDRNLAIEIVGTSGFDQSRMKKITSLFEKQTDWALKIVLINLAVDKAPGVQSEAAIEQSIHEIGRLVDDDHLGPALLLAWAVFEAVGRTLLADQLRRPQTSGSLVQSLAASGHLTPEEADDLRKLAGKRNALAHGDLLVEITRQDMGRFLSVMATLRDLVPA